MPLDDIDPAARADAVRQLATDTAADDPNGCGPEPPRPTYFSTQAARDAWIKWNLCRAGVRDDA